MNFKKHWHILKSDLHLQGLIPPNPPIIFMRAKTLKNKLVPSEFRKEQSTISSSTTMKTEGTNAIRLGANAVKISLTGLLVPILKKYSLYPLI